MVKIRIYAFWKYDLFPYISGGEVTEIGENLVETKEYGKGRWFTYVKIFPFKEGKKIQQKLDLLEEKYYQEKKELLKKFLKERNSIIKL